MHKPRATGWGKSEDLQEGSDKPGRKLDSRTYRRTLWGVITIPITQARTKLYQLVDDAAANHEPVQITGRRNNAVLVSEEDWRSIQETLHLLSIPGMRESIREGLSEPLSKSSKALKW